MGAGKEKVQPVITGTFPAQRFFDTLALILSEREKVKITVKVTQREKEEESPEAEEEIWDYTSN